VNARQILSKFENPKRAGGGWVVRCPAHQDDRSSLSVGEGDDGRVLLFCHAGCTVENIVDALGLRMNDLRSEAARTGTSHLAPARERTFDYRNVAGDLVFQVVRKEPKKFLQRQPNGDGGWIWKLTGVKRVPYRLHELASNAVATVWIVEGEKDANRLWDLGLPATCNAGGAGKWGASETKALRDIGVQRVIILPDNDGPGMKHALDVQRRCKNAGMAASIVTLYSTPLPKGADVSDWLDEGHTREELEALADAVPYSVPPTVTKPTPIQPAAAPAAVVPDDTLPPDTLPEPTKYAPPGGDGVPYDVGAAEAFRDRYGDRVRYDHVKEQWLVWAGHYWRPDATEEVMLLAKQHARLWQQEAIRAVTYPQRAKLVNFTLHLDKRGLLEGMMKCAQWHPPISTDGSQWDKDPWLLGVPNGVVDLRTGELREGRRDDWITQQAGTPYDPAAACPRWMQFLDEVFEGDVALIDYVHRALGYSLTGDMREQVFFMALGGGANGKSILLDTLEYVWGSYGHRANMRIFIGSGDAEKFHLAELAGRRLIFAAETKPNTRMNEHVVKNFTGGETQSAERKFGHPFTFKPVGKIWLGVNHQPKVMDDSFGFWRRVRLVPFNRTFTGSAEDRGLRDKLKAEAAGILAWAVRGCRLWQETGLQTPQSVMSATEAYQVEEDPLSEFIAARCEIDPEESSTFAAIFSAYVSWADEQGISRSDRMSRRAFGMNLKRRFAARDENGIRKYDGVWVRPSATDRQPGMLPPPPTDDDY
jgi:putative DNA primase/helicase